MASERSLISNQVVAREQSIPVELRDPNEEYSRTSLPRTPMNFRFVLLTAETKHEKGLGLAGNQITKFTSNATSFTLPILKMAFQL